MVTFCFGFENVTLFLGLKNKDGPQVLGRPKRIFGTKLCSRYVLWSCKCYYVLFSMLNVSNILLSFNLATLNAARSSLWRWKCIAMWDAKFHAMSSVFIYFIYLIFLLFVIFYLLHLKYSVSSNNESINQLILSFLHWRWICIALWDTVFHDQALFILRNIVC